MVDEIDRVEADRLVIAAIPATLVELVWPQVEPLLMKAVERSHGEADINALKSTTLLGDTLIVTVSEGTKIIAASTLEVRQFDTGLKTLYVSFVGGERIGEWLHRFFEVCKAIAKDLNCSELRAVSVRKGWMRKLQALGWEEISTVIKCELGE